MVIAFLVSAVVLACALIWERRDWRRKRAEHLRLTGYDFMDRE